MSHPKHTKESAPLRGDRPAAAAIAQLAKSERGRRVLRDFKAMFLNGANALDSQNKQALFSLTLEALSGNVDFDLFPC